MAKINWKSQQEIEEDKNQDTPSKEEMNSIAILELAEQMALLMGGGE